MDVGETLVHAFAAVAGWEGVKYLIDRVKNRYRYRCPDCDFRAKSNSSETIAAVKRMHPPHPKSTEEEEA